jgi:hypothetical protein
MLKGPATWNCRQSVVSSSTTAVSAFVPGVARGSAAKPPAAPVSQIVAIIASAGHTRASSCLLCFLFIRCSFFSILFLNTPNRHPFSSPAIVHRLTRTGDESGPRGKNHTFSTSKNPSIARRPD